jgi:hypothetical protein
VAVRFVEKLKSEAKESYRKLVLNIVQGDTINSDVVRVTLFDMNKDRDELEADVERVQERKEGSELIAEWSDTRPRLDKLMEKNRAINGAVDDLKQRHELALQKLQGEQEAEIAEAKVPLEAIASERLNTPKPHELAIIKRGLKAGCSEKTRKIAGSIEGQMARVSAEVVRLEAVARGEQVPNPEFKTTNDDQYIQRSREYLEREITRLDGELDKRKNEPPPGPFNPNPVLSRIRSNAAMAKRELRSITDASTRIGELSERYSLLHAQLEEIEPQLLTWDDVDI